MNSKNENQISKLNIKFQNLIQSRNSGIRFYSRFFYFDLSIFNVEFTCFSLLPGFSKHACIPNFLENHFLTL